MTKDEMETADLQEKLAAAEAENARLLDQRNGEIKRRKAAEAALATARTHEARAKQETKE